MRVLVVEDERVLADRIAEGLRDLGMAVDTAYDGDAGLEKALVARYDVIVLDRDLPRMHGDTVCKEIVHDDTLESRILMLTAAGDLDARVEGLTLGADDYLGKPFAFNELVARVRALGRRGRPAPPVLVKDDLRVDTHRGTATRAGYPVTLSRKEFAVLEVLMRERGRIVSPEELLEKAWDESVDPLTNAVRMAVLRLRQKLGDPPLIETVVGRGYRM
jgi:DNA-binding response OmpR family regulator